MMKKIVLLLAVFTIQASLNAQPTTPVLDEVMNNIFTQNSLPHPGLNLAMQHTNNLHTSSLRKKSRGYNYSQFSSSFNFLGAEGRSLSHYLYNYYALPHERYISSNILINTYHAALSHVVADICVGQHYKTHRADKFLELGVSFPLSKKDSFGIGVGFKKRKKIRHNLYTHAGASMRYLVPRNAVVVDLLYGLSYSLNNIAFHVGINALATDFFHKIRPAVEGYGKVEFEIENNFDIPLHVNIGVKTQSVYLLPTPIPYAGFLSVGTVF